LNLYKLSELSIHVRKIPMFENYIRKLSEKKHMFLILSVNTV